MRHSQSQKLHQELRKSPQQCLQLPCLQLPSKLLLAVAAAAAMTIAGCSGEGGSPTTQASVSPPPDAASPSAAGAAPAAQPANDQSFPQPTVSPQASPRAVLPPDLISSTDPNQRVRVVQSDRPDPFALLPTTPSVQIPPPPQQTVAAAPSAPPLVTPNRTNNTSSTGQGTPGVLAPIPNLVPSRPAAPPPPPQPELARAVQVTGVVQIGGTVYAIVNAPNEPASRYVQAGQSLSNGEVRVRRIETVGMEPTVVLEQFGVEVVRAVGEGGAPAVPADSPAALASATTRSS